MILLTGMIVALWGWPSAAEVEQAAARVYRDDALQRAMPAAPAPVESPPPGLVGRPGGRHGPRAPRAGSGVASTLMWVILGLCVVALIIVYGRELWDRSEAAPGVAGDEAPRAPPAVEVSAQVLGDAEALAAAGRYAEAIRTLLQRTFSTIGRERALTPSTTSREILAAVPMQSEARGALGQLVLAVELTLFGGEPATEADYARCLDAYRRVLGARGVRVV